MSQTTTPITSPRRDRPHVQQLHRTPSNASLASQTGTSDFTVSGLITKGRALIQKIETSHEKNELPQRKTMRALGGVFLKLEQLHQATEQSTHDDNIRMARLEDRVGFLEDQLQNENQRYQELLQKIPTTTSLVSAVREVLTDQQTITQQTNTTEHQSTTPGTPKATSYSAVAQKQKKKNIPEIINRRTLLIKGTERKTAKEIDALLAKENRATAVAVEKILQKKNHIEITCHTETEMKTLQQELSKNQQLNRHLNFIQKPMLLHKMILLGVPKHMTTENLYDTLERTYYITQADIQVLREQINRHNTDTKDIILLLPKSLGKAIISDGGVIIGLKTCKLRPHTSIQRCRRCQLFHHNERNCRATSTICENCGNSHDDLTNCRATPHCINCERHNEHHGTRFNNRHKASDSSCPSFRSYYSQERERLDVLFQSRRPQSQQQLAPTQPEPHRPPLHENPYIDDYNYDSRLDFEQYRHPMEYLPAQHLLERSGRPLNGRQGRPFY